MKSKLTKLTLDQITIDPKTQSRATMNEDTVGEYCELMTDGVKFPPITVFYDDSDYVIGDGFHRVAAMKMAGINEAECKVKKGTWRDALLFSIKSNNSHGLRRTNTDKHRAVELVLQDPEWSVEYSGRKLAKLCGVSHTMVQNIKKKIESTRPMEPTIPEANQFPPAEPMRSGEAVCEEMTSEKNGNLPAAPDQTDPAGDLTGQDEGQTEWDADSTVQNQTLTAAVEVVNIDETETISASEPPQGNNVEDYDPMKPNQDSQEDDQAPPDTGDSSATITASLDDNPSKSKESVQSDEDGKNLTSINTYIGRIEIDLPEVEAASEAEAREKMLEALIERLMDEPAMANRINVSLKLKAEAGISATSAPEFNEDVILGTEVHMNMLVGNMPELPSMN
jgi:hypothetical protein